MYANTTFGHTAHSSLSISGAAAAKTIPQPSSIAALGSQVNVTPDELELAAPSGNTDSIYVALEGVATAASKPIAPGASKRFSGVGRNTLSALAASGTQTLSITAFYR